VRSLAEGAPLNTDDHNLLASRASRLGDAALSPDTSRALMKSLDPLAVDREGLDSGALIRILVERGFRERADALALGKTGAEEELALGWIELGELRSGRAARHFARALELDPRAGDARVGLVAASVVPLRQGRTPAPLEGAELAAAPAAVVEGLRAAHRRDWPALADLDAALEPIRPGDGLYVEASRLRIRWRLEIGDAVAAAEAQALAEALLVRRWRADDALLRAAAAVAADRPADAWATLESIARMPEARVYAGRALEIAERLPDEIAGDLRSRLARLAGRAEAPPRAGSVPEISPVAAEGMERTPR
jgi:hypothetical protein